MRDNTFNNIFSVDNIVYSSVVVYSLHASLLWFHFCYMLYGKRVRIRMQGTMYKDIGNYERKPRERKKKPFR